MKNTVGNLQWEPAEEIQNFRWRHQEGGDIKLTKIRISIFGPLRLTEVIEK